MIQHVYHLQFMGMAFPSLALGRVRPKPKPFGHGTAKLEKATLVICYFTYGLCTTNYASVI